MTTGHPLYPHLEQLAGAASVFSVIDLETTGWSPRDAEIVEVGVVQINTRGELLGEYDTLVRPQWELRQTGTHGIGAADVAAAPAFAEVAGYLAALLDGTCLVAQNKPFEIRFLTKAYESLGGRFNPGNALDTVNTRREVGEGKGTLGHLCEVYGVAVDESLTHCALYDARLTTEVFLRGAGRLASWLAEPCAIEFASSSKPASLPRGVSGSQFAFAPDMAAAEGQWELVPPGKSFSIPGKRTGKAATPREYGDLGLIADNWLDEAEEYILPEQGIVVITGKHPEFTRAELFEALGGMGLVGKKTIVKNTSLLLVGDKPGEAKIAGAAERGIPTLHVTDLPKLWTDSTLPPGAAARPSSELPESWDRQH